MKQRLATLPVCALVLALAAGPASQAWADHEPANKIAASGANMDIAGPNERVLLLSDLMKTPTPADVALHVTLECSIVTNVTTVGNDTSEAMGRVEVWVEIDGVPVGVTSNEEDDDGKVVFCNRMYRRETSMFDDEDATIKTFMNTRNANAFNWIALNVGNGTHSVEVWAELTTTATENATAEVVIGKRTLLAEPVKASNHEVVQEGPENDPPPSNEPSLLPLTLP